MGSSTDASFTGRSTLMDSVFASSVTSSGMVATCFMTEIWLAVF